MASAKQLYQTIDRIFNPRTIAIAGVSRRMDSFGSLFLRSIQEIGFRGEVYPVNPRYEEIMGLTCYPRVGAIPREVDLAIISTPPETVPDLVKECAESGVRGCVINTAGFSESGTREGVLLEKKVMEALKGSSMRVIGPNCMGLFSSRGRVAIFGGMQPTQGKVSMVSQSGSLSIMAYMVGMERNVLFSKIVSSGNELDLNCTDFLDYYAQDEETGVVLAYLEEVREPRRFLRIAKKMYGHKPLIVWKAGLTFCGGRAAMSHTGALGGERDVWEGVVAQAHLVEVQDMSEMLDVASLFVHLPPPAGRRLSIVSSPGGLAVNAADAAENCGLEVPPLSPSTCARLSQVLPAQGTSFSNPVDMGAGAVREGAYIQVLETLDQDPAVDLHLVMGSSPAYRKGDFGLLSAFTREMKEIKPRLTKPLVTVLLPSIIATAAYSGPLSWEGIPNFPTPTAACKALAKYVEYYLGR